MLLLPMYTFIISIYSDSLFHSCLRCLTRNFLFDRRDTYAGFCLYEEEEEEDEEEKEEEEDSRARTVFTERWRHLTYSNEPNFINNVLLVAKEYFHFKLSNVTKRANLYGIVLFPRV